MTCLPDPPQPQALPHFPVEIAPPDIAPWLAGNTGIPAVHSFVSEDPGPHVALLALMHGNEIGGAIVLDDLLRAGIRPRHGRLSLVFANAAAYARFDPAHPTASRFLDEDLNRVWDEDLLEGTRQSRELTRARALRPLLDTADVVLDLHSMLWPSDPLILSGPSARGQEFARQLGTPALVVADHGHANGRRLIDYPRFAAPEGTARAVLVEAGQHWRAATVAVMRAATDAALRITGILPGQVPHASARVAEVTAVVTAESAQFGFVRAFRGGEVIAQRNTVIAMDGDTEIRTPHDDCLLVMPSLRASRGHTAVRLARFI